MAVDQSKSAGVPADDATSAPADSEHQRAPDGPEVSGSDPAPDLDEMKRKFRAALDRKRGAHASGNADVAACGLEGSWVSSHESGTQAGNVVPVVVPPQPAALFASDATIKAV